MYVGFAVAVNIFVLAGLVLWSMSVFAAEDRKHRFPASLHAFSVATAIIVLVWLSTWLLVPIWYGEPKGAGEAGDMFGLVTSLFSGLAFAGLISTLLMQRQELALQRDELTATRREFAQQRFESTLFSILDLFVSHINNLGVGDEELPQQGRAVLEYYASELQDQLTLVMSLDSLESEAEDEGYREDFDSLQDQIVAYEDLFAIQLEADLGPYFRLLYNAIRHIEKADLSREDKLKYSKIVRAHLSSSEVKLLFFNCLSKDGNGFKAWVESHAMLKHISQDNLVRNPRFVEQYEARAFGG